MWKLEEKLPRFPVPPLDATLDRFLETLHPLLSETELAQYKEKVEVFRKKDGPWLHSKVEQLDKDAAHWWMNGHWSSMYLKIREGQAIYVSPFLVLGDDPSQVRNKSQILKAASLIAAATRFARKVETEELEPEVMAGTAMTAYQYTQLLGSYREPAFGRDQWVGRHPEGAATKHVAIVCENQFYSLRVRNDDGSNVPEKEIAVQIAAIMDHAVSNRGSLAHLFPIGILTAGDRNQWAKVKAQLRGIEGNKENLRIIDEALIVLCLDSIAPKDTEEMCTLGFHGTPGHQGNRYYDKHAFYCTKGGNAGIVMEHTAVDGVTVYRMLREVFQDMITTPVLNEEEIIEASKKAKVNFLPITTTSEIRRAITEADGNFKELVAATDFALIEFNDFGKSKIKQFKVSPDAFYQSAIHLATRRTLGRSVSTYESASIAHYQQGRTETIRSLTKEMKAFVDLMQDASATKEQKLAAFRAAASRHQEVAKLAKSGEGQDRLLQGLNWTAQQVRESLNDAFFPSIFSDPIYTEAMSNRLSTSNVGGGFDGVRLFGFGAVHMEGLAVGYMINDNSLPGTVSSYSGKAKEMAKNLQAAFRELAALCA